MPLKARFALAFLIGASLFALAGTRSSVAAVSSRLTAPLPGLPLQMASANIFSDTANAKEDIRQAILKAANEHKHVILDFGGNWCEDCQLLNLYFHDPGNASLLAANYVLVDVNVGEYDKNLDIARRYGVPLKLGVPALVVLDGSGHVLYAQRHGEFEKMHLLNSAAVSAFLLQWKPSASHHTATRHASRPATR